MIALIDADILPYEYGGMVQLEDPDKPLEWEIVRSMVDDRINQILEATKADSCSLYLTDSATNFRIDLATIKPYKGHRKTEKPYHWERIRQHLIDSWDAEVQYGIEADDRLGIEQMKAAEDRKSTRLNSSHVRISYAVFCLK